MQHSTTSELVRQVRAAVDDATRNPLLWCLVEIAQYGGNEAEEAKSFLIDLVRKYHIKRMAKKYGVIGDSEIRDFDQTGALGVLEAIRKADLNRQADSFIGYAYHYVKGKMSELVREGVLHYSTAKKNRKPVLAAYDRLYARTGVPPTNKAVATDVNRNRQPNNHISARMVAAILRHRDARCSLDELGDASAEIQVEEAETEVGLAGFLQGEEDIFNAFYTAALRVFNEKEALGICLLVELRYRAGLTRGEIHARLTESSPCFDGTPLGNPSYALSWPEYHNEAGLPSVVPKEWDRVSDVFRDDEGNLICDRALDYRLKTGFQRLRARIGWQAP